MEVSGLGVLEWIRCLVVVTGLSWWKFCFEQQGPVLAQLLSLLSEWGLLAMDMEFCYLVSIVSSQ